ncbi:synapse differentiation-inducing gene protein 1-like [Astyanax mexicanus]|uniref:Synapse differentiation-inducing gene protein 1-like n=1 Tax=Astyanax mexicanus TaxID=7994 RepID=A0A8T2MQH5_ASTMX|nr:synapse differentiation-inducing gene protein 1-like [Astyanax mexicanus]
MDQQPPPYRDYNAGYPQHPPGPPPNQPGYPQVVYAYGPPPQQQLQPIVVTQQNVTVQPTVCMTPVRQKSDYLCCSIFTMLCCFFPLGLVALILSIMTRDANMSGDELRAATWSRAAGILNAIALTIGLIFATGLAITVSLSRY